MSRIYDQLTLPETGSAPVKAARTSNGKRTVSEDQPPLVAGEQGRQLRIDELANQARLHVEAIERAHKRTADEVKLAEAHSLRLSEETRLEHLARERAEAEQAERVALVARVEVERQLIAQLEVRIEQEKIERAQAAQRAAQEQQYRRVVAEREEQERLLLDEENAAQIRLHEATIEEARKQAADEVRRAEKLAAQLREEKRLEQLARERAQAEEDERQALASRIETEHQLTAQIEVRIEQEKIQRAQANKKALHEEQLRAAAAVREAHERQLRLEESEALLEAQQASIQEANKRSSEEARRARELAERIEEETRLEALARERMQIEQAERIALAARIEAERQLTAQIEARIEQERLEIEQTELRDAHEDKLKWAIAEREAVERQLQAEELAAIPKRREAPLDAVSKRGLENIRRAHNSSVRVVEEQRLKENERKQSAPTSHSARNDFPDSVRPASAGTLKSPGLAEGASEGRTRQSYADLGRSSQLSQPNELSGKHKEPASIQAEAIKAPSRSAEASSSKRESIVAYGLNRRYLSFIAVLLLAIGVVSYLIGGFRNSDTKPEPTIAAQPLKAADATPVSPKANAPAKEIPVETPPSSQMKVEVASAPVMTAPPVPHSEQAVTEVPEVKISALPVPKAHTAIEHADPAVKSKQHAELEIRREVMQWAEAWSRRDVASYLSFYAADFNPPDGMQRATWEEQRKSRLRQYQSIKLTLKNMKNHL